MGQILIPGTAIPAHVLASDTFSAGPNYIAPGTMPNNGVLNITPTSSPQAIPAGYASGGTVAAIPMTPGSCIIINDSGLALSNATVDTKVKELKVNQTGSYRLSFDLYVAAGAGATGFGTIYKNGVAIGTVRSTSSTSPVTYTQDIAGWNVNDLMQVYSHTTNPATNVQVANFTVGIAVDKAPTFIL